MLRFCNSCESDVIVIQGRPVGVRVKVGARTASFHFWHPLLAQNLESRIPAHHMLTYLAQPNLIILKMERMCKRWQNVIVK